MNCRYKPSQGAGPLSQLPPVGILESCFPERNGTPRQGLLAPSAKARLRITATAHPAHSIEGLDQFSHVWLLFVFHFNTNQTISSKVHPPRLGGDVSVGLFATRTPHRPLAIGLSIAKLDAVAGDTLHLSGIDLVHGTPILDVKPYIPRYDSLPDARAPDWINVDQPPLAVVFTPEADEGFRALEKELRFFKRWEEVRQTAAETLSQDIRAQYLKTEEREGALLGVCIDTLNILYSVRNLFSCAILVLVCGCDVRATNSAWFV